MSAQSATRRMTHVDLLKKKAAGEKVAVLTCYDASFAALCDAAGGSIHLLDQPLQRFQRDLNTGAGHAVFDADRAAEVHGRILVGLEPALTDLL